MSDNVIPMPATLPPDPDGELVGLVVSRLLQEPDAAARLKACAALDGPAGRIAWVRQLSVRQLRHEGRTYEEIGQMMGVTRARAQQVDRGRAVDDLAYAWGRLLSVVEYAAYLADRTGRDGFGGSNNRYFGEVTSFVTTALASSTRVLRVRAEEMIRRYTRKLARDGAEDRAREIGARAGELLDDVDRLADGLPDGAMTLNQRAQVVLGLHHERAEREAFRP